MNIKHTKIYFYLRLFLKRCYRYFFIKGTGRRESSRFYYSVFLRHLVMLHSKGMENIPRTVAEFGPGDNIGCGLCALLTGSDEYYAMDMIKHTNKKKNLKLFDELVLLFKNETDIPNDIEFPDLKPNLENYTFPFYLFKNRLKENLLEQRIKKIKQAIMKMESKDLTVSEEIVIRYIVPWESYPNNYPRVELIFSHDVLEHIDNLENFYKISNLILKEGAFMSHNIDFRSHNETYHWNGHWGISDKAWAKLRGSKPYLINREPLSTHLKLLHINELNVIQTMPNTKSYHDRPSITKEKLIKSITNDDFNTTTCFIIAKKIN